MVKLKNYENGLTLIVSEEQTLSTSFAIMVGVGSVNETEKTNGLSHFIEHVNFKGTKNLTAFDINYQLDYSGSNYNAYTGVEVTCFHAQSIPEQAETTFKIMSDMVFGSVYPEDELNKERGVILEEINMSEDDPSGVAYELLYKAFYGDDGYGRNILGSKENVNSFNKTDILKYYGENYVSNNIVITFVGKITLDEADKYVSEYVLPYIKVGKRVEIPKHNIKNKKQNLAINKDIEQCHLWLGFPTCSALSEQANANSIANSILGGGMSSRLYSKLREQLGLVYSVGAGSSRFIDSGMLSINAALTKENVDKCLNAIVEVVNEVKKGISLDEFEKVRNQFKASAVFSQERPTVKTKLLAKYYLQKGEIYDFNEKLERLAKITKLEVEEQMNEISFNDMATAIVGNNVTPIKI